MNVCYIIPCSITLLNLPLQLLSNAQKFCDIGYIGVSVSMTSANQVKIKISDSGCGIPTSFRAALFQPYTQANTSLARPRLGIGLGLSIVKHLLQRMGGTVDVDSTEGEGTCFTVILPAVPLSPVNTRKRSSSPKRVRVIYDHPKAASYFVDLFNFFGFIATSGSSELSTSELTDKADLIWTNINTLDISSSLLALVSSDNPSRSSLPSVFVVYSDVAELERRNILLASCTAHGVAFVKRPVILHSLLACFEEPTSLSSTLPLSPSQSRIPQQDTKGRVLLAEDNHVCVSRPVTK